MNVVIWIITALVLTVGFALALYTRELVPAICWAIAAIISVIGAISAWRTRDLPKD